MSSTAHVEVLTAQVRTLMVGSRQITLSVAKQLDRVPLEKMEPWGRVCLPSNAGGITIIGKHLETGDLVTSWVSEYGEEDHVIPDVNSYNTQTCEYERKTIFAQYPKGTVQKMSELPLIVLAGLK